MHFKFLFSSSSGPLALFIPSHELFSGFEAVGITVNEKVHGREFFLKYNRKILSIR
jgi:hypothetical protein